MVGREGKYVTTRQMKARFEKELERNVALRVEMVEGTEAYAVKGRGVLHLAILIETMRREGYELSVGKPRVIFKTIDGKKHEPFETLRVEVPTDAMGPVMELVGIATRTTRRDGSAWRLQLAAIHDPLARSDWPADSIAKRHARHCDHSIIGSKAIAQPKAKSRAAATACLISMVNGKSIPFAMFGLQDRGELLVPPGTSKFTRE